MHGWLDRKIAPMLAAQGKPFDSPKHLFEIKWDGIRTIAFVGPGRARLQGRRLLDSTARYPEVVDGLRRLPGEAVLDGEIIVLEEGRPSFERVLEREQINDPDKALARARSLPAAYVAFDLLYLNGTELLQEPLSRRRELLSRLLSVRQSAAIVESAFVLEHGTAYYDEVVKRGLEGIVAKALDSPYVLGKRTRFWIKCKARRTMDCVVLGTIVDPATGSVKSLVLGAYRQGELTWMGNVGSGLDSKTLEGLATELGPLAGRQPQGLEVKAPGEIRWLKPALVARLQYLEITREGRLRGPVFLGFVDAIPESCAAPSNNPSRT